LLHSAEAAKPKNGTSAGEMAIFILDIRIRDRVSGRGEAFGKRSHVTEHRAAEMADKEDDFQSSETSKIRFDRCENRKLHKWIFRRNPIRNPENNMNHE
jgi:hypothetical protein